MVLSRLKDNENPLSGSERMKSYGVSHQRCHFLRSITKFYVILIPLKRLQRGRMKYKLNNDIFHFPSKQLARLCGRARTTRHWEENDCFCIRIGVNCDIAWATSFYETVLGVLLTRSQFCPRWSGAIQRPEKFHADRVWAWQLKPSCRVRLGTEVDHARYPGAATT